jgi:glycosyltransferase involved in cell wall biosynthesis
MERVPLSVVVLTKNESARLRDCLASVAWAAERLVVDDESTDETVAVAAALGARVVRRAMDVEGRHRNWAHAQAAHEWVLSLDADERVTPELAEEIAALFRRGPPPYDIYAIPRRNYIGTHWVRYGGWYPSAQVKLFKRSVFRWEEAAVHPRAIAERPSGELRGDLVHLSYRDRADFLAKQERHTTLEAQKWIADGRRVTRAKALWRTVDRFLRAYLFKQGFLEGGIGFFVARMAANYQWVSYRKYRRALQERTRARAAAAAAQTGPAPSRAGS